MSKRSKACEFPAKVREAIKERDGGCIFCKMYGYSGFPPTQIMHYVARSQGGRGVEQNGALGCALHHQQLDNGKNGLTMKEDFKNYLQSLYEGWNEKDLVYRKE